MKATSRSIIGDLLTRNPIFTKNEEVLMSVIESLIDCFKNGHKLLVCGNGGSAADSLHIVGELMKGFILPRQLSDDLTAKLNISSINGNYVSKNLQGALPAIALVGSVALESAYSNDKCPDLCFAQQVLGLGDKGDVLLGISTSGNSMNVIYAIDVARAKGLVIVGLTGKSGGKMNGQCDHLIQVQEEETYKVQELHLPLYHCICLAIENEFFGS